MDIAPLDENKLKEALKAALIEVLEERRDLVRDALEEALEDIGLVYAIQEGEHSPTVSRDDVFDILKTGA
ncbi:MAG: hypothetical protein C4309_00635 [Chloroflexota bacterium]|mgnify:CR=1 FL=1